MNQKLIAEKHDGHPEQVEEYRTSLTDACEYVLKLLLTTQKPHSISSLARESKLHRQTVEKCIYLLMNLQKKWLDDYRLKIHNVDNKRIVEVERKTGCFLIRKRYRIYL